jgi:hypothetical protein
MECQTSDPFGPMRLVAMTDFFPDSLLLANAAWRARSAHLPSGHISGEWPGVKVERNT